MKFAESPTSDAASVGELLRVARPRALYSWPDHAVASIKVVISFYTPDMRTFVAV